MFRKINFCLSLLLIAVFCQAQTNPVITNWLQNTTITGTYYIQGNSTAVSNNTLVNCQQVEYSNDFVYVSTTGIPAYPTGPFNGNPSNAEDQDAIFKFPLAPQEETGTKSSTTGGNIGVFINGVALFDYRDGVAWNPNTNELCGGPGNSPCPGGPMVTQAWNRDAVWAEMGGFDCSKAHPAMGNYHHHQNPSAFKYDLNEVSTICNLYDADGLYTIDSTRHAPLIGFAYDGFPIYGAYGYANADGSGGIARIKSGYQLRDITERLTHADGTSVDIGPDVNSTYFLGFFREDYEWIDHMNDDFLDIHNGRFCITPEYPSGTYAYFATVDENWNSFYPYVVGPTFYGEYERRSVTSINEATTIFVETTLAIEALNFSANLEDNYVSLNWLTQNEINNDYFTLERSTDAQNFSEIAVVKGAGNSDKTNWYNHLDKELPVGEVYYRLKQTDFDGNQKYGNVISVQIDDEAWNNVTIFPNPSSDYIGVQMIGLVKNKIDLHLFDLAGNLLKSTQINPGSTIGYFDTQTTYNGEYILLISSPEKTISKKVTVFHD